MRVCIDPGHGGAETGAINSQVKEKDINLIVATHLKNFLIDCGFEVKMTREADVDLSLQARCDIANSYYSDLFVSVHHNANDGRTSGHEVIHSVLNGDGQRAAQCVSEEFKVIGQNSDSLGVYSKKSNTDPSKDYYYVIKHTNAPAIITEFCYLDSNDYSKIDEDQDKINEAIAIAKGICKYFKVPFAIKSSTAYEPHWAETYYNNLTKHGIIISEKRYDDNITRGEVFALLSKAIDKLAR